MWLIIEISFAILGVWILATRKIPKFLFGRTIDKIHGNVDRFIGIALLSPIPLSLIGDFLFGLFLGEIGTKVIAPLFERAVVLIALFIAIRLSRQLKQETGTQL